MRTPPETAPATLSCSTRPVTASPTQPSVASGRYDGRRPGQRVARRLPATVRRTRSCTSGYRRDRPPRPQVPGVHAAQAAAGGRGGGSGGERGGGAGCGVAAGSLRRRRRPLPLPPPRRSASAAAVVAPHVVRGAPLLASGAEACVSVSSGGAARPARWYRLGAISSRQRFRRVPQRCSGAAAGAPLNPAARQTQQRSAAVRVKGGRASAFERYRPPPPGPPLRCRFR